MSKFCFKALLGEKCPSRNCDFIHRLPQHMDDVFKIKHSQFFKHLDELGTISLLKKWKLDLDWASAPNSDWSVFPSIY